MNAVILRDMRTRFFNHGLGFLVQSLWPLVHMFVILGMSASLGRTAPVGDSPILFFATGIIPALTFIYISRFMCLSLVLNKPMLAFPVVRITDILFGRAFLEVIAGCITLAMVVAIFVCLGVDPMPVDLEQAVLAYMATILLAVGIGTLAGVASLFLPVFVTVYALMGILFYLTSGALFVASNLPDSIAIPLSYNPVIQCTEWMRTAYFETYSNRLLDKEYLVGFGLGSLCLGLLMEKFARGKLLES
ncbi:capsular biosynthesis protein [Rhizobium sp. AC27/96]|uniref:ABC transporter permease n=1 Tax=Rhizobium sp. AC27/96 TaxID=1841653 RepID=UPI0008278532|nr:ABC transporter permease [Rhizobium sp. AC27/96]OCJ12788.1 capsular biosynthesis protein [Rhizobium sp. AC27/96]